MAEGKQQNPLVIAVLLIVIVVGLTFIVRSCRGPGRRGAVQTVWHCVACNREFEAPYQDWSRECPDCGGEAVRKVLFYCSVHDHVFPAFYVRPVPQQYRAWEEKQARGEEPDMIGIPWDYELLVPGETEWKKEAPRKLCCPEENCDPRTMEVYRPGRG